ncbi:MAG: hypothetical protein V3R73_03555 [Sphingomonadales bacterium]
MFGMFLILLAALLYLRLAYGFGRDGHLDYTYDARELNYHFYSRWVFASWLLGAGLALRPGWELKWAIGVVLALHVLMMPAKWLLARLLMMARWTDHSDAPAPDMDSGFKKLSAAEEVAGKDTEENGQT